MTAGRTVRGRAWDSFDGYLFDIDGTLLHCSDAVHYFGFCEVLSQAAGRPLTLEGVAAHGNVDVGILRDAFARAGVADAEWRPRLPALRAQLCGYVEQHRDELCTNVLPGVRAVLEHLRTRGAVLGTATGNLGAIGRAKLEHAELWEYFTVGGWSDEHETRTEVFRGAVTAMRSRLGGDATLCVVGDTPADIRAGRENGLPVIAVATGIFTVRELQAEEPELLVETLEELL